jgi:hypothetical protein
MRLSINTVLARGFFYFRPVRNCSAYTTITVYDAIILNKLEAVRSFTRYELI